MILLDTNVDIRSLSSARGLTPCQRWFDRAASGAIFSCARRCWPSCATASSGFPPGARANRLTDGSANRGMSFADRILPFDRGARARVRARDDRSRAAWVVRSGPMDALIAAIAMTHDAALATRDVDDFEGLGLGHRQSVRIRLIAMPLRLIFMGTPDFAVPTLVELVGRGHDIAAVYTRAPKPAGRGMELQADAGRARGAALRPPGADAEDAAQRRGAARHSRAHRRRCRGGGRLRADPAEADSRRGAARLLQPACLAAAALARRRADQPRHHGGRRRKRRHGDEDGGGARHRRRSRWPSACRSAPT